MPVRTSPAKQATSLLAIRPAAGAGAEIREALGSNADILALKPHNLLIVKLPRGPSRAKAGRTLARLRREGKIEFATAVLRDAESGLLRIPTDEIIVRYKRSVTEDQCKRLVESHGLEIVRRNEFVPNQYIVRPVRPAEVDSVQIAAKLDKSTKVEFAAPNFISQHQKLLRKFESDQ